MNHNTHQSINTNVTKQTRQLTCPSRLQRRPQWWWMMSHKGMCQSPSQASQHWHLHPKHHSSQFRIHCCSTTQGNIDSHAPSASTRLPVEIAWFTYCTPSTIIGASFTAHASYLRTHTQQQHHTTSIYPTGGHHQATTTTIMLRTSQSRP